MDYVRNADGSKVSVFFLTVDGIAMAFPAEWTSSQVEDAGKAYATEGMTVVIHSHMHSHADYPRNIS